MDHTSYQKEESKTLPLNVQTVLLLKGGGHSKKRIFVVNANKNLALSLATH